MNWFENIELAFTGLFLNKLRSFLTMLGIIIGIGAVIAIFTIGNSFQGYMSSELQTLGANNITVVVSSKDAETETRGNPFGSSSSNLSLESRDLMQDFMIEALYDEYQSSIHSISLSQSVGSGQSRKLKDYANINILGINNDYVVANDLQIIEGRGLSLQEQNLNSKVALVSEKTIDLLKLNNPIGETLEILVGERLYSYTIVGVFADESTSNTSQNEQDVASSLYIPLGLAQLQSNSSGYQSFTIVTQNGVDSSDFAQVVNTYMNNFYLNNKSYEVRATSLESVAETMSSLLSTLELAISAIAALALLVGGIGVMNIMYVSITERTKEIGTRKALGATNLSIQIQFITESAILTLVGGLIGIGFGLLLGLVGSSLLGYPGSANLMDMLIAVGTSMVIGIFFGYYPATKAAKMDPIEALRYE